MIFTALTTLIVGATLLAAITAYFWPQIMFFCKRTLIPWLRKNISDSVGEVFAQLLHYVDDIVCFGRRKIKAAWKWLNQTLLAMVSRYIDKGWGQYSVETETKIYDEQQNNCKVITKTQTIEYEDLPVDVRHKMNERNLTSFSVDDKEITMKQVKEAVKKKETELTSADILEMKC